MYGGNRVDGGPSRYGLTYGNAAAQVEDPMSLLRRCAEELTLRLTTPTMNPEDRKERERAEDAYAERGLYQDLMHEASRKIDRLKDSRMPAKAGKRFRVRRLPFRPERLCSPSEALDAFFG